ncbi:MAG: hypothetical protein QM736_28365 [Vicinamibacterales bacterium]
MRFCSVERRPWPSPVAGRLKGIPGELHAALRLSCRHDLKSDALDVIGAIDPENGAAARAAALALRAELPVSWRDDIVRALQEQPRAAAVHADVLGFKRVPVEAQLLQALGATSAHGRPEVAWALGRVGSHASVGAIRRMVNEAADVRTQRNGSIALLRLGDDSPAVDAQAAAAGTSLQQEVLGLAGDPACVPLLLERLRVPASAATAAFALGLLGDLSAVGPLLALLAEEDVARPAAVALNTITGAQLHARVFVPYTFDVDELTDEERAAFERDGTVPTRAGEPFGTWERRPLVDQASWRQWLEQNKHRFHRGARWRAGLPYGPDALVRCIKEDTTPHVVRSAAYRGIGGAVPPRRPVRSGPLCAAATAKHQPPRTVGCGTGVRVRAWRVVLRRAASGLIVARARLLRR